MKFYFYKDMRIDLQWFYLRVNFPNLANIL